MISSRKIITFLVIIALFFLGIHWGFHWASALLFGFTGVIWFFLFFVAMRYTLVRFRIKSFLKTNPNPQAIVEWMAKNVKSTHVSIPPLSVSLGVPGIALAILFFYHIPWLSPFFRILLYIPLSLFLASFIGGRLFNFIDFQKKKAIEAVKNSNTDFCQKAMKIWIEKEHALLQKQLTSDQQPYGYYFDPSLF